MVETSTIHLQLFLFVIYSSVNQSLFQYGTVDYKLLYSANTANCL